MTEKQAVQADFSFDDFFENGDNRPKVEEERIRKTTDRNVPVFPVSGKNGDNRPKVEEERIRKTTDRNVPVFPVSGKNTELQGKTEKPERPIVDPNNRTQSEGVTVGGTQSIPAVLPEKNDANTGNWRNKTDVKAPEFKEEENKPLSTTEERYQKFMDLIGSDKPFAGLMEGMAPAYDKDKEKRLQTRAKYQALGDAFKLLAEGVGASKGAIIQKRSDNPYIAKTLDELDKMRDKYHNDKEQYKMVELQNKIRQIATNREDKRTALTYALSDERFDKSQRNADKRMDKQIKNQRDMAQFQREFATSESLKQRGLTFDLNQQRRQDQWSRFFANMNKSKGKDDRLEVMGSDGKLTKLPQGVYWDIVTKIKNDEDLSKKIDVLSLAMGDENAKNALNILVADYHDKYYTSKDGQVSQKAPTYDIDMKKIESIMQTDETRVPLAQKRLVIEGYLKRVGMPETDIQNLTDQLF
jgi:hypothetical protein